MAAVTHAAAPVIRFVQDHFIPVQLNVVAQPAVKARFYTDWTPTILIHNAAGREARRSEGYLGPSEFIAELSLGRVKAALYDRDYAAAVARAREALDATKGDALREPEAYYWLPVAEYRASGDTAKLSDGWDVLIAKFPGNDWAKRADI